MTKKGRFITLDGIDGAGKTTQIDMLADRLRSVGKSVYITREPGGTELSEKIRLLLLSNNNKMSEITELLLMFAARAEHVEMVLRPRLISGEWIICSRFSDATMAYQGYARGISLSKIESIANLVHGNCNPDLSLFLDLPVNIATKRRLERGNKVDRFEAENIAFMEAVRQGYLAIAKKYPKRCKIISAKESIEKISTSIWQWVSVL